MQWRYENGAHHEALKDFLHAATGEKASVDREDFLGSESTITEKVPFVKISGDSIPFPHLSSGLRSLFKLAHVILFTVDQLNRQRENRSVVAKDWSLLFLVDEPERSLHPDWQQRFFPAILAAAQRHFSQVQIMAVTHSPFPLVGFEHKFDQSQDGVFHIDRHNGVVDIERIAGQQGTIGDWMLGDAFGLNSVRNRELEAKANNSLELAQASGGKWELSRLDEELKNVENWVGRNSRQYAALHMLKRQFAHS